MPRVATAKRRPAAPSPRPARRHESLLVELLTEELPPRALPRLSEAFETALYDLLRDASLLSAGSKPKRFATPRRLAVRVTGVLARQPDRVTERAGPKQSAPAAAVEGFARSCGVSIDRLALKEGRYCYSLPVKGEPAAALIPDIVARAVKALPIPKLMRWGAGAAQFVRPVHGLVLVHGAKLVPGELLGVRSGNRTLGHRFLANGPITIGHADKYETLLATRGKVLASFDERRAEIEKQLRAAATRLKAHAFLPTEWTGEQGVRDDDTMQSLLVAGSILGANQSLLDEVTALVEWPRVYVGEFEREFLEVPAPCISLTMQKNQKYFALMGAKAELLPAYLIVSNMDVKAPQAIVDGNARVLRARLADAKFFYDQDRKTRLADRLPRLAAVVYHNKLGSQLDRVERQVKLAVGVATRLGLSAEDSRHVERAARLAKADLATDMVGEFPELQGVMGSFYAAHDGEAREVAQAIEAHYRPRYAGDYLPRGAVSLCVAVADKLDVLSGIYGIGLAPTGDKDPFGLRRAALGLVRLLVERHLALDVRDLLELARSQYPAGVLADGVAADLYAFLLDRLRGYLREHGFGADEIEAVLALNPTRLDEALARLEALKEFRRLPEAEALAAANKRIHNILRQAGNGDPDAIAAGIDGERLREEAERHLAAELGAASQEIQPLTAAGQYKPALARLARLRGAVDSFFDKVLVMAEDEAVRTARLQLLAEIRRQFRRIADLSRLQS